MLASDANNKDFVGATNPDDLLHVEFYWHEPMDKWESEKIGKPVKGPKQPFVRIMRPGDQLSIIEQPVHDWHKARFASKWMAWQISEGLLEGEYEVPGWKIEEWAELNPEQVHELKFLRFSTVEQIAGASDAQVQRLGMGGLSLREKAKRALRDRMGSEVKSELEAKEKELQEMRERMSKLEALVLNQQPASPQPPQDNEHVAPGATPFPEKKKRKYTRKAQAEQVSG